MSRRAAAGGPDGRERRWALVRLLLGAMQMSGAIVSLVLIARGGVTSASLAAVVLTSVSTSVSVMLFGSRKRSG